MSKTTDRLDRIEKKIDALLLLMQGVNSLMSGTDNTVLVVEDLPEVKVDESP